MNIRRSPDVLLASLVLSLFALGLAALYTAGGEERFWVQFWRGMACAALMAAVAFAPAKWLESAAPLFFAGALLALIGVLLFGVKVNNARRWLDLGVHLQPSELMKIALPMCIAFLYARAKRIGPLTHVSALLLAAVPAALVVAQPDLGTAVMVATAGVLAVFFGGVSWRWIAAAFVAAPAAFFAAWHLALKPYQKSRILTVFDPQRDPLGAGYHAIQSEIAIGSGGVWGKGFLAGTQAQLGFLPERHTDFIFAVFAEEFGLIGGMAMLSLALLITWRGLAVARRAETLFGFLAAAGIAGIFFIGFATNLFMVSGLLPVVGLPLPLVSYGGTSLLATFLGFGVILAVSRRRGV